MLPFLLSVSEHMLQSNSASRRRGSSECAKASLVTILSLTLSPDRRVYFEYARSHNEYSARPVPERIEDWNPKMGKVAFVAGGHGERVHACRRGDHRIFA